MLQVQYYPGNRIRNNIPHKHDEKLIELDDEGRVLDVISQPGQPDIIKCFTHKIFDFFFGFIFSMPPQSEFKIFPNRQISKNTTPLGRHRDPHRDKFVSGNAADLLALVHNAAFFRI